MCPAPSLSLTHPIVRTDSSFQKAYVVPSVVNKDDDRGISNVNRWIDQIKKLLSSRIQADCRSSFENSVRYGQQQLDKSWCSPFKIQALEPSEKVDNILIRLSQSRIEEIRNMQESLTKAKAART